MLDAVQEILGSLQKQMADIDTAATAETCAAMEQAVTNGRKQFSRVQARTSGIRESIEQSSQTIRRLSDGTARSARSCR